MYAIVNLETRALLTYPQGDVIQWGNAESAVNAARYAENLTDSPHSMIDTDAHIYAYLSDRREVAPWC